MPYGTALDVTVLVTSKDGAAVYGVGQLRGARLEPGLSVRVPVRRDLLYVANAGQNLGLIALDLHPAGVEPPAPSAPIFEELLGLREPHGVYVTADGARVVTAGQDETDPSAGVLVVFSTDDHVPTGRLALPGLPAVMTPIGDGARAALMADRSSEVWIVDVETLALETIPLFDQASRPVAEFRVDGMDATSDGARLFIAGDYFDDDANDRRERAFAVDLDGGGTPIERSFQGDGWEDVKVAPGDELFFAVGASCGGAACDGFVETVEVESFESRGRIPLPAGTTDPENLLLEPGGRFAYVGLERITHPDLPEGACCQGSLVVDLEEREVLQRVEPDLVSAGLRLLDGSTVLGLFRAPLEAPELLRVQGAELGPTLDSEVFVNAIHDLASPFGSPL